MLGVTSIINDENVDNLIANMMVFNQTGKTLQNLGLFYFNMSLEPSYVESSGVDKINLFFTSYIFFA